MEIETLGHWNSHCAFSPWDTENCSCYYYKKATQEYHDLASTAMLVGLYVGLLFGLLGMYLFLRKEEKINTPKDRGSL